MRLSWFAEFVQHTSASTEAAFIQSSIFMALPNFGNTCLYKEAAGQHQPRTCAGLFTFTVEAAVVAADCVGSCIGGEVCDLTKLTKRQVPSSDWLLLGKLLCCSFLQA